MNSRLYGSKFIIPTQPYREFQSTAPSRSSRSSPSQHLEQEIPMTCNSRWISSTDHGFPQREQPSLSRRAMTCCLTELSSQFSSLEESGVLSLIKRFLSTQRTLNSSVNPRVSSQSVVPQILERRIQPIDSTVRLFRVLPRVVLRIHHHSVSRDAVPGLSPSRVLDEIYPAVSRRESLVLVAVPLRQRDTRRRNRHSESPRLVPGRSLGGFHL